MTTTQHNGQTAVDAAGRMLSMPHIRGRLEYLTRLSTQGPKRTDRTKEMVSAYEYDESVMIANVLLDRLDAAEKENAELRAKLPQPTQSDRECAERACEIFRDNKESVARDDWWGVDTLIAAHTNPIRACLDEAVQLLREARDEVVELGNYYAVYDKHRPDRQGACIVLTERIDAFLVAHPRQGTTIDAEKGAVV